MASQQPSVTDELKKKGKSLWAKAKVIGKDLDEMTTVVADSFDQKEKEVRGHVSTGLDKAQGALGQASELIKPK